MNKLLSRLAIALSLLYLSSGVEVQAQTALKTNIVDDATLSIDLGAETKIAPKWTVEAVASLNAWTIGDEKRWKHLWVQPGVRYWLCDALDGHFFGAHLHGGQYNIGGISGLSNFLGTDFSQLASYRFQGWFVGAGISYGYSWILGEHWNIEAEIGLGWAYTRYDKYPCAKCGTKIESNRPHNYVGPTKAALNLVYVF